MHDAPDSVRTRTMVRAYTKTRRARDRTVQAVMGLFDGLWLGVLDREALYRIDQSYYDRKRKYVDDEYNARGLHDWEQALVSRYFAAGSRIAVTGAGGGREVYALLEQGYDAVGFEPNPNLVAAGNEFLRRRGHEPRLHLIGRDAFPADSGRWDGVLVGWGSYMLIPGRSRRLAFLRDARHCLAEGSHLVVTFFVRPPGEPYFRHVQRIGAPLRRLRGIEEVELGDALVPNFAHHFVEETIAEELRGAAFELVEYQPEPYGQAVGRAIGHIEG